jgi:hypothetical protein
VIQGFQYSSSNSCRYEELDEFKIQESFGLGYNLEMDTETAYYLSLLEDGSLELDQENPSMPLKQGIFLVLVCVKSKVGEAMERWSEKYGSHLVLDESKWFDTYEEAFSYTNDQKAKARPGLDEDKFFEFVILEITSDMEIVIKNNT